MLLLAARAARAATFAPPVLITPPSEPNWLAGYADVGARLTDDMLLWQPGVSRTTAAQHGSPVYSSTDRGSSWRKVFLPDRSFRPFRFPEPDRSVGLHRTIGGGDWRVPRAWSGDRHHLHGRWG